MSAESAATIVHLMTPLLGCGLTTLVICRVMRNGIISGMPRNCVALPKACPKSIPTSPPLQPQSYLLYAAIQSSYLVVSIMKFERWRSPMPRMYWQTLSVAMVRAKWLRVVR